MKNFSVVLRFHQPPNSIFLLLLVKQIDLLPASGELGDTRVSTSPLRGRTNLAVGCHLIQRPCLFPTLGTPSMTSEAAPLPSELLTLPFNDDVQHWMWRESNTAMLL